MTDVLSPEQRRFNMSRIRSRDTQPERVVRSLLHRMGLRFRLQRRDLPGRPDIVLTRHRLAVMVHGCFWHMHGCRYGRVVPKTRTEFWQAKRSANVERDRRNVRALRRAGWRVLVVWECSMRDTDKLAMRLARAVKSPRLASDAHARGCSA